MALSKTKSGKIKATKPSKKASKKSLLTKEAPPAPTPANVDVNFSFGVGQLTASQFRKGALIDEQSITRSKIITLADVQSGDTISINAVSTGTADISISVRTSPATPEHFGSGNINTGYDIL